MYRRLLGLLIRRWGAGNLRPCRQSASHGATPDVENR
jgi:hypothetical protein